MNAIVTASDSSTAAAHPAPVTLPSTTVVVPPPPPSLPRKRLIADAAGDLTSQSHGVSLPPDGDNEQDAPPAVTLRSVHSEGSDASARSADDAASLMAQQAKKRKFVHTTEAQRRSMLEWLETPPHFEWLTAPAGAAVLKSVSGKRMKKTDGFRALMRHVNSDTNADWSMEVTKSRFESFLTTYRKAKALVSQRDFGVTQSDRARGITDVDQKLNSICLYFDRIDALFSSTTVRGRHHVRVAEPQPLSQPQPQPPVAVNKWTDDGSARVSSESKSTESLPLGSASSPTEWQQTHAEPQGNDRDAEPRDDATESEHDDAASPQRLAAPAPASGSASASAPAPEQAPTSDVHEDREQHLDNNDEAMEETRVDEPETSSPPSAEAMSALDRERLDLLQEQLAMQKRDLELRERALQRQEEEQRQRIRADIVGKLIEAGKGLSEIKEYLTLIEGGA
ncbi:hypothetical protein PINS_up005368 [Pythium insidiosum]|nr:hypothetical protein PINS_up005368 [Pythium insidiosum]